MYRLILMLLFFLLPGCDPAEHRPLIALFLLSWIPGLAYAFRNMRTSPSGSGAAPKRRNPAAGERAPALAPARHGAAATLSPASAAAPMPAMVPAAEGLLPQSSHGAAAIPCAIPEPVLTGRLGEPIAPEFHSLLTLALVALALLAGAA